MKKEEMEYKKEKKIIENAKLSEKLDGFLKGCRKEIDILKYVK